MPDRRAVKSIGGLLHPGPDSDYGRGRSEWLDFPWDRHQHRMRIDGREVNYVDAGIIAATLLHPWNRELCATEDVVCGEDWPELARNLDEVLR